MVSHVRWMVPVVLVSLILASCSGGGGGGAAAPPPPGGGAVVVNPSFGGTAVPGAALAADAGVVLGDGSALMSVTWTQVAGLPAGIMGAGTQTPTITLGTMDAYRDELIDALENPPIDAGALPPTVSVPPGGIHGGLQDRFQVVGVNPFALEEAAYAEFEVVVVTSSGTYTETLEVHTHLPWKPSTGLRTVPIGTTVLLHAKDQATWDWTLTPPAGSAAALVNPMTRSPEFTPDVSGLYTATVLDLATMNVVTLEVYAGTWVGVITGQDAMGHPIADAVCTSCHQAGGVAPDNFTPWSETGHARILSDNIDNSSYYGDRCFDCHTVGYDEDTAAVNNGIDDQLDYSAFIAANLLGNPGNNWENMLQNFPNTARMSNVQCENCHGPQGGTGSHATAGPMGQPRTSLSSDVCADCHGEPLRHARFQQWQLSGHSNYELAIDESQSGSCSRCHTANGFLTWLPILTGEVPGDPTASITVNWTEDESHPQTCVTCHDPHAAGTTSGISTNATVRISGNTPLLIGGFVADTVGRGAICMTCHNSRRGLRNDTTFASIAMTNEVTRAPHGSSQADVVMGENAYFVNAGVRGAHSFITDTCVNCHMEQTPPPAILAYNLGGTNHTFAASPSICANCHDPSGITAANVQASVDFRADELKGLVEQAWLSELGAQLMAGNTLDLNGQATVTSVMDIVSIELGEFRGRQSLTFELTGGVMVGPLRTNDIDVVQPMPNPVLGLPDVIDDRVWKAGWNWALVHNDGSHGVHNPTFALEILNAACDEITALLNP